MSLDRGEGGGGRLSGLGSGGKGEGKGEGDGGDGGGQGEGSVLYYLEMEMIFHKLYMNVFHYYYLLPPSYSKDQII